ncbi:MAG: hypothetical protein PHV30_06395 [Candidatus Margulisbacteria bacterium]|nr:hypothetical protein [Candidatus Margulisiibacteriota bacterium]
MKKIIITGFLLITLLFLIGCEEQQFIVLNAKQADIEAQFIDFVGISGYKITYKNMDRGLFRIKKGTEIIPETKTTMMRTIIATSNYPDFSTEYMDLAFQDKQIIDTRKITQKSEQQRRTIAFAISITQQQENVLLTPISQDDMFSGDDVRKFADQLEKAGYQVGLIKKQ